MESIDAAHCDVHSKEDPSYPRPLQEPVLLCESTCACVARHPRSRLLFTAMFHPPTRIGSGHSLGAGTAILLKILLARHAVEVLKGGSYGKGEGAGPISARLDVGRPVHVECYAFAPPPVFSAPGAIWMRDVYSFVNG